MTHRLEHVSRNPDGNGFTIRYNDQEWHISEAHLRSTAISFETMTNIFGSVDPMPRAEEWIQILLKAGLL